MIRIEEELLKLISQVQDCGCDVTDVVEMIWVENRTLVDHLIANGVVIPVRCEKCRHHFCVDGDDICRRPGLSGEMIVTPDGFCAWGESRNGSI